MSYILEALKKSEKKRQDSHASLAELATQEPHQPAPPRKRRPLWPLLLGLALVINAAVMLLMFWPESTPRPVQKDTTATAASAEVIAPVPHMPHPVAAPTPTVDQPEATDTTKPHALSQERHAPEETSTASVGTPTKADSTRTQPPMQKPEHIAEHTRTPTLPEHHVPAPQEAAYTTALPAAQPRLRPVGEMPLSYRQQLPEMHMSVHVYAGSPDAGLVRINQHILRPGELFAERLLLEEITPEGAVFSYLGQRFLLPRGH